MRDDFALREFICYQIVEMHSLGTYVMICLGLTVFSHILNHTFVI